MLVEAKFRDKPESFTFHWAFVPLFTGLLFHGMETAAHDTLVFVAAHNRNEREVRRYKTKRGTEYRSLVAGFVRWQAGRHKKTKKKMYTIYGGT